MCGIVGFIDKECSNKDKESIIKSMSEKIKHRGPDGVGYYIDDFIAISHRRLAIVDVQCKDNLIFSDDRSFVISYNGEIYNYKELKEELKSFGFKFKTDTDTEVILKGYECWGSDVVNHLRGMFAFAIWNNKKNELFLARDPFGIKPLYYTIMNNTFMFASEVKSLLEHPNFNKELNKEVLASYLCFGFNPSNETFFKNVFVLPAGYVLLYKDDNVIKNKYFSLNLEDNGEININDIKHALNDSVSHHLMGDVSIGSFLSGGVDSSALVSIGNIKNTYTVGYENDNYNEIDLALSLTEKLKVQNKSKKISKEEYMDAFKKVEYFMDEPLADAAAIPLYFLSELAKADVKVVMTGEGADELFGGYLSYKEEVDFNLYMKIPYVLRKIASVFVSSFKEVRGLNFIYRRGQKLEDYYIGMGRIFRTKDALKLVNVKKQLIPENITKKIYEENKEKSNIVKRQAIDFNFWLVNDFLRAVDRITMMFGIEGRVPYLDKEVYRVASKIPEELKINKIETKVGFRQAVKEFIPNDAYKRKKLGFPVPLREWLREDDVYREIKDKFGSDISRDLFNYKEIMKLLEKFKSGKTNNYKKIWTIYTFLVWYDIYFA